MTAETETRVIVPVDEQRVREMIAEAMRPGAARGCICPPGAEATCRGIMCPRTPLRYL